MNWQNHRFTITNDRYDPVTVTHLFFNPSLSFPNFIVEQPSYLLDDPFYALHQHTFTPNPIHFPSPVFYNLYQPRSILDQIPQDFPLLSQGGSFYRRQNIKETKLPGATADEDSKLETGKVLLLSRILGNFKESSKQQQRNIKLEQNLLQNHEKIDELENQNYPTKDIIQTRRNQNSEKTIRRQKVERYLIKKKKRKFQKRIVYQCRKSVADNRERVKGRFVKRVN